jgi:alkanesulfonate monooxygenase SsuD/methylene tetrahydromethanopterin reductase-like flavin-dependent oxidoreductase (luciferase family)
VAEVAAAAEAAGWDGVFVWDHLWNRTLEPFADPWITLAAIAVATERVVLGPLVTPLPRRRVQVVAQHSATLDRLAGGRFVLGLGLGHDDYGEYSDLDEPLTDAKARAERLDADLGWLLGVLGGAAAPSGARRLVVDPVQRPRYPIWVAGSVERKAGPRRAVRHGLEGVAVVGGSRWQPEHVERTLAAAGRDPGALDVVLVGGEFPDPDALAAAGATWAVPELAIGATVAEGLAVATRAPA